MRERNITIRKESKEWWCNERLNEKEREKEKQKRRKEQPKNRRLSSSAIGLSFRVEFNGTKTMDFIEGRNRGFNRNLHFLFQSTVFNEKKWKRVVYPLAPQSNLTYMGGYQLNYARIHMKSMVFIEICGF